MKEEAWSIRRMREERKHSSVRNTYKRVEDVELKTEKPLDSDQRGSTFDRFFKGLAQFLEE